jgi:hypothetical protein
LAKNHKKLQKFAKIYKNSQKCSTFEQVWLGVLAHLIENNSHRDRREKEKEKIKSNRGFHGLQQKI